MSRSNLMVMLSLAVAFIALIFLGYFFLMPSAYKIISGMETYETRVANRNDYKLHTTPLPETVIKDLCLKLEIGTTSENCKPKADVYAPELFDEVKAYFNSLPEQDKAYTTVQNKLGSYLVQCAQPDPEGDFRCKYDFRGDQVYPVFFYFNKKGFYWQIIANIGGS